MRLWGRPWTALIAVAALVLGLTIGATATATADGLSHAAVTKIVKKVLRKQSPRLSVAKAQVAATADRLAGKPPGAYEENRRVITVTVPADRPATGMGTVINLETGLYEIAYSAYLEGGSGSSRCQIIEAYLGGGRIYATGGSTSEAKDPALSATTVVTMHPQPENFHVTHFFNLVCTSDTPFVTDPGQPTQIFITRLDQITREYDNDPGQPWATP